LDRDHAEQAVGAVIWSCSKEEFVGGAVCTGTLAEVQSPKLINRYRRAGCVGQCAEESAAAWVEGVDPAVLDVVGDQDRIAELAEIVRSQCEAPRGMEWAVDGVVFENGPVRVENIDKTVLRLFREVKVTHSLPLISRMPYGARSFGTAGSLKDITKWKLLSNISISRFELLSAA
jgi:hypothetical protein